MDEAADARVALASFPGVLFAQEDSTLRPVQPRQTQTVTVTGYETAGGIAASVCFAMLALLLMAVPDRHRLLLRWHLVSALLAGAAVLGTVSFTTELESLRVRIDVDDNSTSPPSALRLSAPAARIAPSTRNVYWQADVETYPGSGRSGGYPFRVSSVPHRIRYRAGFWGSLSLAVVLLIFSMAGVRHALASDPGEPAQPIPSASRLRKPHEQGSPMADVRFSVPESIDVWSHARFHFGGLGYTLVEHEEDRCAFERGSVGAAFLASDIRLFPTRLTVRLSPPSEGRRWVHCHWSVRSMGAWITRRDIRILEDEGKQLQAWLLPQNVSQDGPPPMLSSAMAAAPQRTQSTGPDPVQGEIDLVKVRAAVDGPSLALMLVGSLTVAGHVIAGAVSLESRFRDGIAPIAIPGIIVGALMLVGGYHLRSLRSRGWAQIGALSGVIPISLAWPLTLAIGIWAVRGPLNDASVSAAFLEAARRRSQR